MKDFKVTIAQASEEDSEGVGEVFYRTWLDTYPNKEFGITLDDIEDRFKDRLSEIAIAKRRESIAHPKDGDMLLTAKDMEKVVGVCRLCIHSDKNEIRAIYILPEYQKQGIGKQFWEQAKHIFDNKKDTIVNVVTYNTEAIEFYKKLGFVDTGKRFSDQRFTMKSGAILPEMEMIFKQGEL